MIYNNDVGTLTIRHNVSVIEAIQHFCHNKATALTKLPNETTLLEVFDAEVAFNCEKEVMMYIRMFRPEILKIKNK